VPFSGLFFWLIGMAKYLSRADELALIVRAQAGDNEAVQLLLENHANFTWKMAIKYQKASCGGFEIDDLVQVVTIGMIKAIQKFDTSSGWALLTFAFRCVQSECSAFLQGSDVIRSPRGERAFTASLDAEDRDGNSRMDILSGDDESLQITQLNEVKAEAESFLAVLPDRERMVITNRMQGETLATIAERGGVSKERIRQIESRAMKMLIAERDARMDHRGGTKQLETEEYPRPVPDSHPVETMASLRPIAIPKRQERFSEYFKQGVPLSEISADTGVSTATLARYRTDFEAVNGHVDCRCGKPGGHKGRCLTIKPHKPTKPSPDFPLTAHDSGRWCKKLWGKTYYFGKWSDPEGAVRQFEAKVAELQKANLVAASDESVVAAMPIAQMLREKASMMEQEAKAMLAKAADLLEAARLIEKAST
jgi:RNA polymerase sigma factor (sigma-70 family)